MNAIACERVVQFVLNYTPENFNYLCTLSQNSKPINRMEKLKLLLKLENNILWIKKKKA